METRRKMEELQRKKKENSWSEENDQFKRLKSSIQKIEMRKLMGEVVDNCHIYKKNTRLKSKPLVAISQIWDFNNVFTFA